MLNAGSGWRGGDAGAVAEPADDVFKVVVSVEAMIALEIAGDVFRVGVIEEDDANVGDDTTGFIDAIAEIIGLAGSAESSAGRLFFLEALKPSLAADDDNEVALKGAVTAPFVPAFVRAFGLSVEQELVEDDADAS